MTAFELASLALNVANQLASYQAMQVKMQQEGRNDLTAEELAKVRQDALAAIKVLLG